MKRELHTAFKNAAAIEAQRKRELGHIHQGKARLGWSDDCYRYHLQHLTGHTSAAELDAAGRAKVLAHMAKLGYRPASNTFKPFDQAAKIKWYWKKLAACGALRDGSPAALCTFIARQLGQAYADPKFIPTAEASRLIEALKAMLARAERAATQDVAVATPDVAPPTRRRRPETPS